VRICRLLVANRGEVAVRIIGTCRRLGIATVLAASDVDLEGTAARLADEVVRIGPAPATASYLDVDAVVAAALRTRVDALHPGYGFLSENPRLAEACDAAGVTFVGPTGAQLRAVGDKLHARRHAEAAGVPLSAGGEVTTPTDAIKLAGEVGWPVLVKAVGGGGGRGLRRVERADELVAAVERAMAEAEASFGDARVYLERFVTSGRHVEVQVLGDGDGDVVHLGTRDCSIQRRYQKLVEEAPAPDLDDALRDGLHGAAVALARRLSYRGAGTVEFLVDRDRGTFAFLEVNARIQVEHPVTEQVTGIDLVAAQLALAEGHGLPVAQDDVTFAGHAIECRINAEDPARGFRPSPGTVTRAVFPVGTGVRVDTHVQRGAVVPPHYDSLLAKLVVTGTDRTEALDRLRDTLGRCHVEGVDTNLALHARLAADPDVRAGPVDTTFLPALLTTAPIEAGHG